MNELLDQDDPLRQQLEDMRTMVKKWERVWIKIALGSGVLIGWNVTSSILWRHQIWLALIFGLSGLVSMAMAWKQFQYIRRNRRILKIVDQCLKAQTHGQLDFWMDQLMAS